MILLRTLGGRWYAFAFIAAFFWAASAERGWRRAVRFLAVAGFVSLIAEALSTHTPCPYGRYHYLQGAPGSDLSIAGVPLFVPLSFGVVVWAGRALATAGFGARTTGRIVLGGAALSAVIDLVIDPMTVRGHQWFIGPLYAYDVPHGWFGVPWSNYGGWLLVCSAILWIDELLEAHEARTVEPIRGPTLAFAILGMHVLVALFTANFAIAATGASITAALFALTARRIGGLVADPAPDVTPAPGAGT